MTVPSITVLGATGRVGSLVTRLALERGFSVTAVVRDPAAMPADVVRHPGLRSVTAELDDVDALRRAVAGSTAVISTVGVRYRKRHPWGGIAGRADVVPAAVRGLLTALDRGPSDAGQLGPHVVLLSAFGAGDSWKQLPAIARAIISSSALRVSYAGLTAAEQLLAEAAVPHTVVRSVTLTDGPATDRQVDVTGVSLRGNPTVSRADVARLLVEVAAGAAPVGTGSRVLVAGPGAPAGATREGQRSSSA